MTRKSKAPPVATPAEQTKAQLGKALDDADDRVNALKGELQGAETVARKAREAYYAAETKRREQLKVGESKVFASERPGSNGVH